MASERSGIDVETERTLIKALHAVIRDDEDDFEAQLEAFSTKDALLAADARCTDLAALIMLQQYDGILQEASIQDLAERLTRFASWSGITPDEFAAYINAIFNATPILTILEIGPALRAPFILLASLLVNFRTDEETWFNYRDRVWDSLEDGASQP